MIHRLIALTLCFLLLISTGAAAGGGKVAMVDSVGLEQGFASVNLIKGSAKAKVTLAPLPANIDTGNGVFEATIYKAYLVNSTDGAVEVPLGSLYPNVKSKAKVKAVFKGDLSQLGLDRLVIVAFSKDGLNSFDVLTGTLAQ